MAATPGGATAPAVASTPPIISGTLRRGYIDWLRGVAVLIMIEAHALDSWTRPADRDATAFGYAMILGGFGAPLFLFLAGIAVALSAGSKARRGGDARVAARAVRRRGWEIVALAFLFRLQALVLGGGELRSLLKVDILNVMGLAIVGAAALWQLGGSTSRRIAAFSGATAAVAMITPVVRASAFVDALPEPIGWYLRPSPGWTNFTLLPWAAFVLAGAAAGVAIDRTRTASAERRTLLWLGAAGLAIALCGYSASLLPSIYARSNFWTSSPTFFFLRTGILLGATTAAWAWSQRPTARRWSPLQQFGRTSLFIYWIHVEMVYGVLTAPIHRRLPLGWSILAFAAFTVFLFGTSVLKTWLVDQWRTWQRSSGRATAPELLRK
jgi:uncharacterized membrane protein